MAGLVSGPVSGLGPAFLTRPSTGFGGTEPSAAGGAAGPAGGGAASSFADALAALAGDTVGSLKGAESAAMDALQGRGDTRAVADAVMSAEQSLQAAVAIRDKIVAAYLDISRMPI